MPPPHPLGNVCVCPWPCTTHPPIHLAVCACLSVTLSNLLGFYSCLCVGLCLRCLHKSTFRWSKCVIQKFIIMLIKQQFRMLCICVLTTFRPQEDFFRGVSASLQLSETKERAGLYGRLHRRPESIRQRGEWPHKLCRVEACPYFSWYAPSPRTLNYTLFFHRREIDRR